MREHELAGARAPAFGDPLCEFERRGRRRVGQTGRALEAERNERVGIGRGRPRFVGEPRDPEVVERHAGRLEHAEHLDRHLRRLRLEQRLRGHPPDPPQRRVESDPWRDALERREPRQHLVPLLQRLVLGRIEAALARKTEERKRVAERTRPLGGRLGAEEPLPAELGVAAQRPAEGASLVEHRGEPLERDGRPGAPAQPRVEPRARLRLGLGQRDERRADHQARLLERRLAAGERERGERVRDERSRGQRVAERDVERQHAARTPRIQRFGERAPQPPLVPVELRHDDRDARVGVRLEPRPRPAGRELEFRAGIRAGEPGHLGRALRRAGTRERDAASGKRFQQRSLLRRDRVEAIGDEQRRLPHPRCVHHLRGERGEPGPVDEMLAAGARRILARPGRELGGVLAGERAGKSVGEIPRVGERPGLARERRRFGHGEERVAGPASHHVLPEALLLVGREQERQAVGELRVQRVLVQAFDKRGVRQHVGSLPDREAGRLLPAVELRRDRLREAPVRRDDRGPASPPEREPREEIVPRELEERVGHPAG